MGNCFSPSVKQLDSAKKDEVPRFYAIADQYNSIEEVQKALRAVGLESSDLILGVDFTASNTSTGKKSFGGRSLHDTSPGITNPYQQVISIVGRTLEAFDDDKLIPAYGFGDKTTQGTRCFPFHADGRPSQGFEEVLTRYSAMTPMLQLAGPTNFAPVIRTTIETVKAEQAYHILVIIADGQITECCMDETKRAIVEASRYPISIVVIGVGDGPWDQMEEFDDELPERRFDNFQFVPFNKVVGSVPAGRNVDAAFACAALMEIPEQYKLIKQLGYLR